MKKILTFLIGAGALSVGAAHWMSSKADVSLAQYTRDNLIFVEGGTFDAGNYEVRVRKLDGSVETRWVRDPASARPPEAVTLKSFYISADEASAADHKLFLLAQDHYPPLDGSIEEDGSAVMSWAEARDYCAWVGKLSGLSMRLPTENEWEYAARSRGTKVAFATNDGEYRLGVNVQDGDRDTVKKPLRSFPPNPLGLRDLVEGSYEWVLDTASIDPKGSRIAKGGSSRSSSFTETIPNRRISEALGDEQVRLMPSRVKALAKLGPVHILHGTARCVAEVSEPPEITGFGRAGNNFDVIPSDFGPYDRQNNLIERD